MKKIIAIFLKFDYFIKIFSFFIVFIFSDVAANNSESKTFLINCPRGSSFEIFNSVQFEIEKLDLKSLVCPTLDVAVAIKPSITWLNPLRINVIDSFKGNDKNAFFNEESKSISITAGLIQDDAKVVKFTFGHEIIHGIGGHANARKGWSFVVFALFIAIFLFINDKIKCPKTACVIGVVGIISTLLTSSKIYYENEFLADEGAVILLSKSGMTLDNAKDIANHAFKAYNYGGDSLLFIFDPHPSSKQRSQNINNIN